MKFDYEYGNTPIDPNEVKGLKVRHISTKAELNEFEEKNISQAVSWVFEKKQQDYLTEAFLRKLHKKMFLDVWTWAGEYRKTNKNIGVEWTIIATEVRKLLDDTNHWLTNNTFPWDEIAAQFHHRLVSIHPFPNGNGRHARLMTDILLKYNSQPIGSWGSSLPRAREEYLKALKEADQGDIVPLVSFIRT